MPMNADWILDDTHVTVSMSEDISYSVYRVHVQAHVNEYIVRRADVRVYKLNASESSWLKIARVPLSYAVNDRHCASSYMDKRYKLKCTISVRNEMPGATAKPKFYVSEKKIYKLTKHGREADVITWAGLSEQVPLLLAGLQTQDA